VKTGQTYDIAAMLLVNSNNSGNNKSLRTNTSLLNLTHEVLTGSLRDEVLLILKYFPMQILSDVYCIASNVDAENGLKNRHSMKDIHILYPTFI